jgi:hypothetical protein
MKAHLIFISLFALGTNSIFSKEKTKNELIQFHDRLILEGVSNIHNRTEKTPPLHDLGDSNFSTYPFVLWDYAEDIQSTVPSSGSSHWKSLLSFIDSNNITCVITNIKSPNTFPFFSTDTTDPSFITYAKQLPSSCELAVLFALDSFIWDANPSPSSLPSPYPSLPSYFEDLPLKMEWVKQMIALGVPIQEVVIDPQPANVHGNIGDYQLLIDFMDYFRTLNHLKIRCSITYGISERTPTYANLDTFPTDSGLGTLPDNFPPLTEGLSAPEWRPSSTNPLLDRVYIQAYEPDIPYIFTLDNNPVLAATSLLHNFRDEPYLQGIGTISFSTESTAVTGNGTSFLNGDPTTHLLAVTEDMPLGVLENGIITRIGIVSEDVPITATTLSLNSSPSINGSHLPFYQTEIINKWLFPYTNPSVVNNIYIMFSFENIKNNDNPFFGSWSTSQFMSFLESFYSQGKTTLPIYMQDANTPIPMPNNFAIYDFTIFNENLIDKTIQK